MNISAENLYVDIGAQRVKLTTKPWTKNLLVVNVVS